MRHITTRKAILAITSAAVLAGMGAPFLTGLTGSSPNMSADPAVQALLTYTSSLDGAPDDKAAAAAVKPTLTFHPLADGATRVSRVSATGTCYYLTIPATADAAPSPVQVGTPADCQP